MDNKSKGLRPKTDRKVDLMVDLALVLWSRNNDSSREIGRRIIDQNNYCYFFITDTYSVHERAVRQTSIHGCDKKKGYSVFRNVITGTIPGA